MWNQRPDPKIVIARGYAIVAGLVMILAAPLLILFAVFNIVSGDTDAAVLIVVVPLALGAGIWMAGLSTKIRFNPDSMTVNQGHIPLFLWWLRERTVSTVHRAWGYSCLVASKGGRAEGRGRPASGRAMTLCPHNTRRYQMGVLALTGFLVLLLACNTGTTRLDGDCDAAYPHVCIPSPPPLLNCEDIKPKRFIVVPPDPHGFDGDMDGIGCEGRGEGTEGMIHIQAGV